MSELYFKDPKDYIYLEYEMRRNRRPSYSMRAFARDLEFSPSSLNDFLKGRVGMSAKRALQLSRKLTWTPERYEHFVDLIKAQFDKDLSCRQTAIMKIKKRMKDKNSYFDSDKFKVISTWYHLVIIEMCHLLDNIKVSDIVQKIQITSSEAKQALSDLTSLRILKLTDQGLKPTDQTFQYGDGAPSDAIRHFHFQIMQQAQNALLTKNMSQRESHSLVFSIQSQDRHKMNQEIRKSLYSIVNKYAVNKNTDSVQIISFQSFESFAIEPKK